MKKIDYIYVMNDCGVHKINEMESLKIICSTVVANFCETNPLAREIISDTLNCDICKHSCLNNHIIVNEKIQHIIRCDICGRANRPCEYAFFKEKCTSARCWDCYEEEIGGRNLIISEWDESKIGTEFRICYFRIYEIVQEAQILLTSIKDGVFIFNCEISVKKDFIRTSWSFQIHYYEDDSFDIINNGVRISDANLVGIRRSEIENLIFNVHKTKEDILIC